MTKDEMEFVRAGTAYDDPSSGERTEVLASSLDTGDRYRVRLTIAPASRPERHRHPTLTEEFVVRDGEVRSGSVARCPRFTATIEVWCRRE